MCGRDQYSSFENRKGKRIQFGEQKVWDFRNLRPGTTDEQDRSRSRSRYLSIKLDLDTDQLPELYIHFCPELRVCSIQPQALSTKIQGTRKIERNFGGVSGWGLFSAPALQALRFRWVRSDGPNTPHGLPDASVFYFFTPSPWLSSPLLTCHPLPQWLWMSLPPPMWKAK